MGLDISSITSRWIALSLGWLALAIAGCAVTISEPPTVSPPPTPSQTEETPSIPEGPSPRALASLQLTDQARVFLERGEPDDAIRILEHAIHLNPANGQNYFYMSEAWLMKENITQAIEFNRLAGIYLEGDSEWMARVMEQQERIKRQERLQ
ncbi:MAG: hypothetical protein GTO12_16440 [Proteobacteria bacterium]|nr:hypothetical protein [Pseudomonadota bacterium]